MIKTLRELVLQNKQRFIDTKDYQYVVKATVYYGAYLGIGGVKAINLPEYCSSVTDTMYVISKFKTRMSGDLVQDVKRLNIYAKRKIEYIEEVKLDNSENRWFISVKYKEALNPILVTLTSFQMTDEALIEILVVMLSYNKIYNFSKQDMQTIKETAGKILVKLT